MTQYKTAFLHHLKQKGSGGFKGTHGFMKTFYKRDAPRKWRVKEGEQKTKGGFKTRTDIIEEIEDFESEEQQEPIDQEVGLGYGP